MGGCGRTAVAVRRLSYHILSVNVFCCFDLRIGKAVEVTFVFLLNGCLLLTAKDLSLHFL